MGYTWTHDLGLTNIKTRPYGRIIAIYIDKHIKYVKICSNLRRLKRKPNKYKTSHKDQTIIYIVMHLIKI